MNHTFVNKKTAAYFDRTLPDGAHIRTYYCAQTFPTTVVHFRLYCGRTSWHPVNYMHAEAAREDFMRLAASKYVVNNDALFETK